MKEKTETNEIATKSDDPAPRVSRNRFLSSNAAAWAVVVAAVVYGGYLRSINLAPGSLWLDDAWVAVLSRAPTLREFFIHGSSSPPLFNGMVALCIWVLPGREVAAQIFPFVCANLAIAMTAVAAYLLTRRAWAGALAAVIVACDPAAIEFAGRVKQYSSDMLVVAAHVVAFCVLRDRPSVRSLWIYVLGAGAGLLLSTVSVFVVAALFPFTIVAVARRGVAMRQVVGATAAMAAIMVSVYFGVLRPGINTALREFWAPNYLPAGSVAAFTQSAQVVGAEWLARGLHGFAAGQRQTWVVAAGAIAVVLGAFSLLRTPGRRLYVVANVVLVLGILAASAARRFPLGTGRVDLFLVPLLAILIGAGVAFVGQIKHLVPRILWAAAVAVFVLVKFPVRRAAAYPVQISSPLVTMLGREKAADDVLLLNVHASFALGYYSPWRPSFVADATLGTGFHVIPQTTGVFVIGEQAADPQNAVALAVRTRPARIFLLLVHAADYVGPKVEESLAAAGWKLTRREQTPGAELRVFASEAR
jgi:hypothetical protein